jgi:urease, beta subunit
MKIGEIITANSDIIINQNRKIQKISISNVGDRPIQVGSHYHFFEVNKLLKFDRKLAYGMRLNIPSGTSVRFEPGETKEIVLVELGGKKRAFGLNNLVCAQTNETTLDASMERAKLKGFVEENVHEL